MAYPVSIYLAFNKSTPPVRAVPEASETTPRHVFVEIAAVVLLALCLPYFQLNKSPSPLLWRFPLAVKGREGKGVGVEGVKRTTRKLNASVVNAYMSA